jgi:hypothetical protein
MKRTNLNNTIAAHELKQLINAQLTAIANRSNKLFSRLLYGSQISLNLQEREKINLF